MQEMHFSIGKNTFFNAEEFIFQFGRILFLSPILTNPSNALVGGDCGTNWSKSRSVPRLLRRRCRGRGGRPIRINHNTNCSAHISNISDVQNISDVPNSSDKSIEVGGKVLPFWPQIYPHFIPRYTFSSHIHFSKSGFVYLISQWAHPVMNLLTFNISQWAHHLVKE